MYAIRSYYAVADNAQTSIDMPAVAALICIAACLQGKFVIEGNQNYTEPLNLYGLIVANPAQRKSSVLNAMTKYIISYEEEINAKLKAEIVITSYSIHYTK